MAEPTTHRCLAVDCGRPAAPAQPALRSYAGVDLMARDFDSLLRLMLDPLALRAPGWQDRSEADLGLVLLELVAYAGDQLAWLQERVALEGRLRTATQPESVRRLLRLIDVALHPGQSAQAELQFEVEGAAPLLLPAGFAVHTGTPAAGQEATVFETDAPALLVPALGRVALAADAPGGADGRLLLLAADLSGQLAPGMALVLQQGRQRERVLVQSAVFGAVTAVTLQAAPEQRYAVAAEPPPTAHGNLVAATHGQSLRLAVQGDGSAGQRVLLDRGPIARIPDARTADAQAQPRSTLQVVVDGQPWSPVEDFIDSAPADRHYRVSQGADGQTTVVFGDGDHGALLAAGAQALLQWRVGLGLAGRVGPDALTGFDADTAFALPGQRIVAVRNPLPSQGAREPDSIDQARRQGPASLRRLERVVTPADGEALLAEGVWLAGRRWRPLQVRVQRQHTGSWPVLVASVHLPGHQRLADVPGLQQAFQALLAERKMAGTTVQVQDVRFAPLHIALAVDVAAGQFARDVRQAVLAALLGPADAPAGVQPLALFAPGRLRFGQAVALSALYATVAAVPGVVAVRVSRFKRLGDRYPDQEAAGQIEVGALEIARCDNAADSAQGGRLFVRTVGGREG